MAAHHISLSVNVLITQAIIGSIKFKKQCETPVRSDQSDVLWLVFNLQCFHPKQLLIISSKKLGPASVLYLLDNQSIIKVYCQSSVDCFFLINSISTNTVSIIFQMPLILEDICCISVLIFYHFTVIGRVTLKYRNERTDLSICLHNVFYQGIRKDFSFKSVNIYFPYRLDKWITGIVSIK